MNYKGLESRAVPGSIQPLVAIRDPHQHAARRKLWQRGMTTESLRGYEPTIAKRSLQLVDTLETAARKDEEVDLAKWIGYLTFDFMGDMA